MLVVAAGKDVQCMNKACPGVAIDSKQDVRSVAGVGAVGVDGP